MGLLSEVIPATCLSLPAVVNMKVLPTLHPRALDRDPQDRLPTMYPWPQQTGCYLRISDTQLDTQ